MIRSCRGLAHLAEISLVSDRLVALVLDEPALGVHGRGARGHGRRRALVGGGLQVLAAVRAVGLQPIVAAARGDRDAYRAVEEPRSRGYAGARCVRPTEVSTATKVFAATA